jgi:putative ABC transport system substrate-binding protein
MPCPGRAAFIILSIILLFHEIAGSAEAQSPTAAIVVSQSIRPYLMAAEGLREELARKTKAETEEFDLGKLKGKGRDALERDLKEGGFDIFITIGPPAARFIWERFPSRDVQKAYTMVLNPESILGFAQLACGVTLRIPVIDQIRLIAKALPSVKTLGLLQNPTHNAVFVNRASAYAPYWGLEIVPLDVSSKKEIPLVLKRHWRDLDALLLIPDRTVISESIVQYIIKEAIVKRVAVVGFNRFFYESGAALAFVFDYSELGKQTALLVHKILSGEKCEQEPPIFHAWINRRVVQKLGMEFPGEYQPPLEVGP